MSLYLNKKLANIKIHILTGPMFSGKTLKLIHFVDDYCHQPIQKSNISVEEYFQSNKIIILKYFLDKRYSTTEISTHNKIMRPAISCQTLIPHLKECEGKEVIAIDEAQFFDDLFEFINLLIKSRIDSGNSSQLTPLSVILDSLDGDFLRHPFGQTLDLLPICDTFSKERTFWGHDNSTENGSLFKIKGSSFTLRTVKSSKVKLIGGVESYKAANRSEYMKQSQMFLSSENRNETFDSFSCFGFVSLFIGREKCGKTKELIKKILEIESFNSKHPENKNKTLIFVSSDLDSVSKNFLKCRVDQTLPSIDELENYDCVLIDDIHLYPDSNQICDDLANKGKFVFASGLISDENEKIPKEVKLLIPKSDLVTFLDDNRNGESNNTM